jgi:glycosyltransferase involved in cell wall biosynthesis
MFPPYYANADSIIKKIIRRIWETVTLADEYAGWIIPATLKGVSLLRKNQINKILVTGPPFSQFIIGYILSKIFGKKLVVDYQDPWYFYLSVNGFKENSMRYKFNFWLEKKILSRADKIVFNTNLVKKEYCKVFSFIKDINKKSFVIENAFFPANSLEPNFLEKNRRVILYAGNFYGQRKINYLFKPLLELEEKGLIKADSFMIHIFGKIADDDKECIVKFGLQNYVIEHSKISEREILKYMKGADILYLPQGDDVKYSVPYKFFDYIRVKKPILAVTSPKSATAEIVNEVGCGEVADISDSDSVFNALYNILKGDKEYSFNAEKYTWQNITLKYKYILNN